MHLVIYGFWIWVALFIVGNSTSNWPNGCAYPYKNEYNHLCPK